MRQQARLLVVSRRASDTTRRAYELLGEATRFNARADTMQTQLRRLLDPNATTFEPDVPTDVATVAVAWFRTTYQRHVDEELDLDLGGDTSFDGHGLHVNALFKAFKASSPYALLSENERKKLTKKKLLEWFETDPDVTGVDVGARVVRGYVAVGAASV